MGKQVEFFMDKNMESDFLKFVKQQGFEIILPNIDKNVGIKKLIDFSEIVKQPYLLFYNQKFGELSCTELRIKVLESPVIEYMQTYKNANKHEIRRGRIWISTEIDFENNEIKEEFLKVYKVLIGWIKKNIPRQEYVNKGKTCKGYICDEIKRNLIDGYKIPY